MPIYLLDSNIFIQAHRMYYPFDVVPSFWNKILELSNKGFEEIIVSESKAPKLYSELRSSCDMDQISTKQMIQFILKNQQLLRSPITFDDRRLLIGYNNEDIRTFIPWRLR